MQPDDDAHELQWTNKADHDGSNGHTSTKYIPVANPSDNEAPTRPQARRQSILSRWLWELAASLLALILLLAIVAILVPHDGDEQPDWPHVTLGGVVAFIGTIIAAALAVPVASGLGQLKWGWFERERPLADFDVFDEASRGPWGGSKMLLKHRGGYVFH